MENFFNIEVEEGLDKLNKKRDKSGVIYFLKKYKIITFFISAFLVLSFINLYLVYSFVVILTNVM